MIDLLPSPTQFSHPSRLHGQSHVGRVMVHAFRLLEATGLIEESSRLWASVYLHDLARTHDGPCHEHGADAVTLWHESTEVTSLLASRGITPDDEEGIERALTLHCLPNDREPSPDDPDFLLVALLKDADGLDRVRLGDLDPIYLRLPETLEMLDFADELFRKTDGRIPEGDRHFPFLLHAAGRIAGKPVVVPEGLVGD